MRSFLRFIFLATFAFSSSITLTQAWAARGGFGGGGAGGGSHSIGFTAGLINANQDNMNTLISRANTREGGISTSQMNQAYEAGLFYGYRFSGTPFGLQLRPSFFYQVSKGTGASGNHNYSLTGFTFFPIGRLYPLENEFMKVYLQFGLGYGRLNGSIEEGTAKVDFAGGAYGTLLGLGSEFCFSPSHCMVAEGSFRYLTMERNISSSSTGTFSSDTARPSLSQSAQNREVELDSDDFATKMSGLMFMAGYAFYF